MTDTDGMSTALLAALRSRPRWMRDALCREYPTVQFVPVKGQSTAPAVAICARCTVRKECSDYAAHDMYVLGVWGGTTGRDRRRAREQRTREGRS